MELTAEEHIIPNEDIEKIKNTISLMHKDYFSTLQKVIKIDTFESNGKTSTATGFLLTKKDKIFLVTNKHVICEFRFTSDLPLYKHITLSLRTKDNKTQLIEIVLSEKSESGLINTHEKNFIDVAIIDITNNLMSVSEELDIDFFEVNQLIPKDRFENYDISDKSKIIISGYPLGKTLANNYPISISGEIDKQIQDNELFDFPANLSQDAKFEVNKNVIKVNGYFYIGMSGAPSIILSEDYPKLIQSQSAVVGIASIFDENNNCAFLYDSTTILDVLDMFEKL